MTKLTKLFIVLLVLLPVMAQYAEGRPTIEPAKPALVSTIVCQDSESGMEADMARPVGITIDNNDNLYLWGSLHYCR